MAVEDSILSNLIYNEDYTRKVIAFLKDNYFKDNTQRTVFKAIESYILKYNSCPTPEALKIDISAIDGLNEKTYFDAVEYVSKIEYDPKTNFEWLLNNTEKFCQDSALYNALLESIAITEGEGTLDKGSIPKILTDALGVSFDTTIGHDYIEDFEERYKFYHLKEEKMPFDLYYFNQMTKGGISRKTLTIILAGTGVGKSLAMCHFASANLVAGKNVLYITMEMAEEKISERIDVNLMNVTSDELALMSKANFKKKVDEIRSRTVGKLVVKEYPTASAGSATFRALLGELKTKKNFVPDIIYIDYLNICMSSRIKMGSAVNSYTYIKTIAEELRGLAVEFNVPIVSATQTTRSGYGNSDVSLTDTSESFGLPATADLMFALITDEELEALNQIVVKQLKNRYDNISKLRKFVIGIDRNHMRFYDADPSAQENLMDGPDDDDRPVFDHSKSGGLPPGDRFKDLF